MFAFFFSEAIYYLQKEVTLNPCLRVNAAVGATHWGEQGKAGVSHSPASAVLLSTEENRGPQSECESPCGCCSTPKAALRAVLFPALASSRTSACKVSAKNSWPFLVSPPLCTLWLPVYLRLYNFYFFTIRLGLGRKRR